MFTSNVHALLLLQYKISQFHPLLVPSRKFLADDQALQESDVGSIRNSSARMETSIYESVGKITLKIILIVRDGNLGTFPGHAM